MRDIVTILVGDVSERLKELPDESVHCVVTSPPYWGLRDYSKCKCALKRSALHLSDPHKANLSSESSGQVNKEPDPDCPICNGTGVVSGVGEHQLGLEKTPEEYTAKLVEIFQEVRRVLRDDGTVWLNLGDSFASGKGKCYNPGGGDTSLGKERKAAGAHPLDRGNKSELAESGLKPKDLVGTPWRVAFALQADGWYLRSDIIWNKPNPMPESVTDRPTKAHEYIFLLTKSARYFFDQEAVREVLAGPLHNPGNKTTGKIELGNKMRTGGTLEPDRTWGVSTGRNIRSVWTMTTKPYSEAHFATFPPELPERCIKAGTSLKGCCPKCGAPWERIIRVDRSATGMTRWDEKEHELTEKAAMDVDHNRKNISGLFDYAIGAKRETTGWKPTCSCGEAETIPCTVLDIFAGSGTTGEVARNLGRHSILIELNPTYVELIKKRTSSNVPDLLAFGDQRKV